MRSKKSQSIAIRGGVALVLALTLLFIFQVNEMTRESYLVRHYNSLTKSVLQESQTEKEALLYINSLAKAEELIEELGFERVELIHHIEVAGSQVASK